MLALMWPLQWVAFVPIVALESLYLAKTLHLPLRRQFRPVAIANAASTLVGIPLAWLAMLVLEFLVAGVAVATLPEHIVDSTIVRFITFPFVTAWIMGSSEHEVRFAFITLLVPFCAASIYVERKLLRVHLAHVEAKLSYRAIVFANVASYVVLAAIALATLYFSE